MLAPLLQRIDHIGIAVPNLDVAVEQHRALFRVEPLHRERIDGDGVETVMFSVGESRIELLGATGSDSKISRFLARRGGGLHHVAYGVDDVAATMQQLRSQGVPLLDEVPRPGAGGRLVAFLHPRACDGVLVELCQSLIEPRVPGAGH